MRIEIPEFCLVLLVGPSGCGKSTFGKRHFKPTEVISSDFCRGIVSDDENDQAASADAFSLLHFIVNKRLAAGKLTVVDATNVQMESRKELIQIAKNNHVLTAAIVLDLPEELCQERNGQRPDRDFGPHVVRRQKMQLRKSLRGLNDEGIRYISIMRTPDEVERAEVVRERLWTNRKDEHGPFDIIGDIHGCFDELEKLISDLGYVASTETGVPSHPEGRKIIFLGDLVDRGPKVPEVLETVMSMVRGGSALCVPGNHDVKLLKKLRGRDVRMTHGLIETWAQLEEKPEEFKKDVAKFIDGLISHLVLDDGNLVVAHAGLKEFYQGRSSGRVREFCLYGETTGETDEYGLPVRYNWAMDYRGKAKVVYGHTPVLEPSWLNRTICVDTGCVYGGKLTALRYPENELVAVPALQVYYESSKPFLPTGTEGQAGDASVHHIDSEDLNIEDVMGKRIVATRLAGNVTVREENARAALEVMSRFALNPRWLPYLPPTMSPCQTSKMEDYLERPEEALTYYRDNGVDRVILEEKHMGSRAIVIVCDGAEAAKKKFGDSSGDIGVIYTRTGRAFFGAYDKHIERELLERVRRASEQAGLFKQFNTSWIIFDCELMPWSAKAQGLLQEQYAAVGSSSNFVLAERADLLRQAKERGLPVEALYEKAVAKENAAQAFVQSYRNYCWPVKSIEDLKLAPFQIIATEGRSHMEVDHQTQMEMLARLAEFDRDIFRTTKYLVLDVSTLRGIDDGIDFFEKLTASGGEGMVVKPLVPIVLAPGSMQLGHNQGRLIQPAVKCRGREYLRIIYGPDYTLPENIERLRSRGLGGKRALAAREFALGVEAIERFVKNEPLYKVHECVFAVLALESEPMDPRL